MLAICARIVVALVAGQIKFRDGTPLLMLVFFITLSATFAYMSHGQLFAFYNTTVSIASYFPLALAFFLLTEKEKALVLKVGLFAAFAGIGVQEYLILTKNTGALMAINPYYQERAAAGVLAMQLARGQMPRILPSGILLIAMCSGYTLVIALAGSGLRQRALYGALYLTFTLFMLSTGTRSYLVLSALVFAYALYSVRRIITAARRTLLIPVTAMGVALMAVFVLHSGMFSSLVERTLVLQKHGYYDPGMASRTAQSLEAIRIILGSPFGIGVRRPLSLIGASQMWDVHGVLTVGFLGGVPAIICLFWFLHRLYKSYRKKRAATDIISCGAALLYALALTMFNLTSAFTSGENLLAFNLFAGYVLSKPLPKNRAETSAESVSRSGLLSPWNGRAPSRLTPRS